MQHINESKFAIIALSIFWFENYSISNILVTVQVAKLWLQNTENKDVQHSKSCNPEGIEYE